MAGFTACDVHASPRPAGHLVRQDCPIDKILCPLRLARGSSILASIYIATTVFHTSCFFSSYREP
jgi:hypothetical protein